MRGAMLAGVLVALALPGGAQGATTPAGVWQGAEGQVRVYQSSNGMFLGDTTEAITIGSCPVTKGHTMWLIEPDGTVRGRSAKVYGAGCADSFSTATFQVLNDGSKDWLRVCVAELGSESVPSSTAPPGTLPNGLGATGCADLGRVLGFSDGDGAQPHFASDYIKGIRRGRCVLRFGPTSFFVKIATVADDPAVQVVMRVNGAPAEIGQKSGDEYRFDMRAKKGENKVVVGVKTFSGKGYTKKKKLYC